MFTLALMHQHSKQNSTFTGLIGGFDALFTAPHRFSFNGMEKDDEVKGIGNSLDFGARLYDSRLGRFLSLDPLMANYPFFSHYLFAGNKPLIAVDVDGKALKIVIHYTKIAPDGTKIILKTSTKIIKEWIYKSGDKAYSVTVVYEVDESGTITHSATIVEQEATKDGEMKSSSNYDYTQSEIKGKMAEDLEYIVNGNDGTVASRIKKKVERDINAPDNAQTAQDIEDLATILIPKPTSKSENSINKSPGTRKGERGQTAKPRGTKNPFKKMKPDPKIQVGLL